MLRPKHLLLFVLILLAIVVIAWYQPNEQEIQTLKIKNDSLLPHLNTKKLFDLQLDYILNNENLCGSPSVDILAIIIVTSYFGNVETRSSMRRATSNEELRQKKIRRLFLLATAPNDKFITQSAVANESERFKDILQGNFTEAYRNLTYKHLMGIKWVCQYCSHAKYVIKMDDDIVVNMNKLTTLLSSFFSISNTKFVSGYVLKNMRPIREPANKWFVTPQEYRPNFYPTFLSGWFYITNSRTLKKIAEYADRVKYFWIDDILVTGILVQMARIKRIDISKYFAPHSEFLQCCMKDLEKNISCDIIIGPNGGDNDLFYKFNEKIKACASNNTCTKRNLPINQTCVAEQKVNLGRGTAFISNIKL